IVFARMMRSDPKPSPVSDPPALDQLSPSVAPPGDPSPTVSYHKVTKIIRGDTIEVEDVGPVRMIGIDTPDGKQPSESYSTHGQNALNYVQKLLVDQEVRLELDPMNAAKSHKNDQDQTLAYVYTREGLLINSELVRLGLALVRGSDQFTASDNFRMLE